MNSGKVLLGILAGLATGATLGILFAPDKGSNTRKKISKSGEDYLNNLKNMVEDFLVKATNELEYVKGEAEDLLDKGKAKAQEVKEEIKNKTNEKLSTQS